MFESNEAILNVNGIALVLRNWMIEDAPCMAKIVSNKKLQNNMLARLPFPFTDKDAENQIKSLQSNKGSFFILAITYDNNLIGSIGIRIEKRHTAEIGFYLDEPYWGKGITTEAVRWMCGYAFENVGIKHLFAKTFTHNKASCRVLEKAGFQFAEMRKTTKNGEELELSMYTFKHDI